jgi:hypothetical protein
MGYTAWIILTRLIVVAGLRACIAAKQQTTLALRANAGTEACHH